MGSPRREARRTGAGLLVALGAATAFGMSGAWARGLIDAGWTPGAAVTARVWVAALVLLAPTVLALSGRWGLLRRNAGMIIAYGLLAVTATQLCYFQARHGLMFFQYSRGYLYRHGFLERRHGEFVSG